MNFFDDLAALAVPLIWILIMAGRYMKKRKQKQDYYAAEDKRSEIDLPDNDRPENKPIHPKGTNW